jgi:hypothetical protein
MRVEADKEQRTLVNGIAPVSYLELCRCDITQQPNVSINQLSCFHLLHVTLKGSPLRVCHSV